MIVQVRQAKKMKETKTEKEGEEAKEVYTLKRNTPTKIMEEWPLVICSYNYSFQLRDRW